MLDLRLFAGNSFFYPVKDSTYVCFKALEASDRELYIAGFKKLSETSVYHRFFGFVKELTTAQIDELMNVDNYNHIAWTAFDIVDDEPIGIGLGRFKRSTTIPTEAELGLTVIDEYQGKGVGTILLAIMYYLGGAVGIQTFTGVILVNNVRLIRRFYNLGAQFKRITNEYEMRLPVYRDFSKLPKTDYAAVMTPVLKFLEENHFCV
ncbi:MAG: GNAT family N-acetyltransferase [Cyclobacteriaceae bacterium]|nr:GNAT family N-acetyltransferase [Cyclobacteriaceae bacterium]